MELTGNHEIVDSHIHLLPGRLGQKVREFFLQKITGDKLTYPLDHASTLEILYLAGIGTAWSFPYAHKPGVAAGMNRSSAEIVKEFSGNPVKLIGGGTVHPLDENPGSIVEEALESFNLTVLKLHCSVGNFEADHPGLNPVWEVVSRRKIPVIIHLGHAISGHTFSNELNPIEWVAQNFPEARLIIAHCGHIAGPQALDLVEKYPQVYADLAPVVFEPVVLPRERVQKLAPKLLFGSDAPNTGRTIQQSLEHIESFGLGSEEKKAILGGNATRLQNEVS